MVIYRHKEQYPISVMCQFFGVSRSGYYGFCKRIGDPEPDAELAELLQSQQETSLPFCEPQKIPQQFILHFQPFDFIRLLCYNMDKAALDSGFYVGCVSATIVG